MADTYKRFLAAPTSSLLAEHASLHYVTTATSLTGATAIIQHFTKLQKQVTTKRQDVINSVESSNTAVLEVDTLLEFQTSGGVYLPGLDDNFLAGNEVHFPVVSSHRFHLRARQNIVNSMVRSTLTISAPRFTLSPWMARARFFKFANNGTKALS